MQLEVKIKCSGYWFLIVGDKNVQKQWTPNEVIPFIIVIDTLENILT